MGFFGSIKQISDTAGAAPAADPDDAHAQHHTKYHNWIVIVGICFGAVGLALGLIVALVIAGDLKSGRELRVMLVAPIALGVGGFMFGMSMMCLFAPRAFLTGPIGGPWMKLIGTSSVPVARIACGIFGVVVTGMLVGIGLLVALKK